MSNASDEAILLRVAKLSAKDNDILLVQIKGEISETQLRSARQSLRSWLEDYRVKTGIRLHGLVVATEVSFTVLSVEQREEILLKNGYVLMPDLSVNDVVAQLKDEDAGEDQG